MSLSTCKLNVQIGSFNVATNELLPIAKTSKSSSSSGRSKASDDLDLAFWLEKSLSPSPDLIAIGFQELLPQTSLRLLTIPTEQAVFIQKGDDRSTLASTSVNSADTVTSGDAASLADASSTPKKETIRLGSQHIAGLEGWLEKLQETISRIHGVQVLEVFFVCNSYRTSYHSLG